MNGLSEREVDLHVWFAPTQAAALRRVAADRRWPVGEVVRDAVDAYLQGLPISLGLSPLPMTEP